MAGARLGTAFAVLLRLASLSLASMALTSCGREVLVEDGAAASSAGGGGASGSAGGGGHALTADLLDPAEVYLAGTLDEGTCGRDALAHWSAPDAAITGFDCTFDGSSALIRPTDGRLVYSNTFESAVRELHCDSCPYEGTYPVSPLDNDPVAPLPPCSPGDTTAPGFLVSPSGVVLHTCQIGSGPWYDRSGAVVHADPDDSLLHLGHGGLALTTGGVLVDLATSLSRPVTGLPTTIIDTVRAAPLPDAFLVVLEADEPAPDGGAQELWRIAANGSATLVGAYPALPPGAASVFPRSSRLDGRGALLQLGQGLEVTEDVIVRRTIGGESAVVYDEADDPLVKAQVAWLITGP